MRSTTGAGLGLAVLSAATFGTSGSFAASLLDAGWSPGAAVALRIAVAALVLTIPALIALRGRWGALRRGAGPVVAYGITGVGVAQLCFFNAVQHVSVSVALLIEYSGTLLVVAWMWVVHGHRPQRLTVAGAAVSVLGLALVVDVFGHQHISVVGVLWALGAAVGLAGYFILSARPAGSGHETVPPIAMAWGGMIVAATGLGVAGLVGAMPMRAATAQVTLAGGHFAWFVPVLGLAVVAGAVAYTTGIAAARLLGARLASFVGLAEVLCAALFAWALLGQRPSLVQGVGGLVVLVGIALVKADEAQPEPPSAELPAVPAVGFDDAVTVDTIDPATVGAQRHSGRRSAGAVARRFHRAARPHAGGPRSGRPEHRDADRGGRGARVDRDPVRSAH